MRYFADDFGEASERKTNRSVKADTHKQTIVFTQTNKARTNNSQNTGSRDLVRDLLSKQKTGREMGGREPMSAEIGELYRVAEGGAEDINSASFMPGPRCHSAQSHASSQRVLRLSAHSYSSRFTDPGMESDETTTPKRED